METEKKGDGRFPIQGRSEGGLTISEICRRGLTPFHRPSILVDAKIIFVWCQWISFGVQKNRFGAKLFARFLDPATGKIPNDKSQIPNKSQISNSKFETKTNIQTLS